MAVAISGRGIKTARVQRTSWRLAQSVSNRTQFQPAHFPNSYVGGARADLVGGAFYAEGRVWTFKEFLGDLEAIEYGRFGNVHFSLTSIWEAHGLIRHA